MTNSFSSSLMGVATWAVMMVLATLKSHEMEIIQKKKSQSPKNLENPRDWNYFEKVLQNPKKMKTEKNENRIDCRSITELGCAAVGLPRHHCKSTFSESCFINLVLWKFTCEFVPIRKRQNSVSVSKSILELSGIGRSVSVQEKPIQVLIKLEGAYNTTTRHTPHATRHTPHHRLTETPKDHWRLQ